MGHCDTYHSFVVCITRKCWRQLWNQSRKQLLIGTKTWHGVQERFAGQADVELKSKRRQQLLTRHQPQPGGWWGSSKVLFVAISLDPQLYRPLILILQVGPSLLSKVFWRNYNCNRPILRILQSYVLANTIHCVNVAVRPIWWRQLWIMICFCFLLSCHSLHHQETVIIGFGFRRPGVNSL